MFHTGLQKPLLGCGTHDLLLLLLIILLGDSVRCEVESRVSSFWNVLRMVVFGSSVLSMVLFVKGLLIMVVVERINFVGLSGSCLPDLVGKLKVFALLLSRILEFAVTAES